MFSSYRENRYLLFLTENYAALQVLKRYLQEVSGHHVNVSGAGGLEKPENELGENRSRQGKREQRKKDPFVLFGSSFPKDKKYTQVHVFLSLGMYLLHDVFHSLSICSGVS